MPIYEYVCQECGTRFDKLVKLSLSEEQPAMVCPACGGEAHKVVSPFALSGSGSSSSESASASDEEPAAPSRPAVTPKEDIDRWRKQAKKK